MNLEVVAGSTHFYAALELFPVYSNRFSLVAKGLHGRHIAILTECGMKVNEKDKDGTCLHYCTFRNLKDIVAILLRE